MEEGTDPARQKVIDEIVEIAIEKIGRAGCRSVDAIAQFYTELMREMGEDSEAKKIEQHYRQVWA